MDSLYPSGSYGTEACGMKESYMVPDAMSSECVVCCNGINFVSLFEIGQDRLKAMALAAALENGLIVIFDGRTSGG